MKTPLLIATALSAKNNNQQTKGGNKRGDGDEGVRRQQMTNDDTANGSDGFVCHWKQQ